MSLTDYLRCPGLDLTLTVMPEEHQCPVCKNSVEIWTDEKKGRCLHCGAVLENPNVMYITREDVDKKNRAAITENRLLHGIVAKAVQLGASKAEIILSKDIVVKDNLAELCKKDPQCKNYGRSMSCPPNVAGPEGFKIIQERSKYSIVVRIDFPSAVMFSDERRDVGRLLHEMVSGVEHQAIKTGYDDSKAFAGGSCKNIFCYDKTECRALYGKKKCRHPDLSRPSMSGFGIDVGKLMRSAGWSNEEGVDKNTQNKESMTWMAGLIVLKQ